MTPEELLSLMDNPDLISGIYNYCDRWCERCKMTSKCMLYQSEKMDEQEYEEMELSDEELASKQVHDALDLSFQLLQKMSEEQGIDLTMTEEEEKEAIQKHRASMDEAFHSPVAELANQYLALGKKWIEASKDLFLSKESQLNRDLRLQLPGSDPEKEAANVKDALDTIAWYLHQIFVKIVRAYNSRNDEMQEHDMEEFPKDSDGSAKIALIGINNSISGWELLLQSFPDNESDLLEILATLQKLKGMVEKEFPGALTFVRPGFDD